MPRIPLSLLLVAVFALTASPALAGSPPDTATEQRTSYALEAFVGGHLFADGTNLGVATAPDASAGAHSNMALGLRASLGLSAWAAAEVEFLGMKTFDRTYERNAYILGYRLNVLAYLTPGNLRPFVLVGAGVIEVGATHADGSAGLVRDREGEMHVGIGLEYRFLDHLSVRADARCVQMPGKQRWSLASDFEATLGAVVTFGAGPRSMTRSERASEAVTPLAPEAANGPAPVADKARPDATEVGEPVPSVPSPKAPASQSVEGPATPAVEQPKPPSSEPAASPSASTNPSTVKELLARAKEIKFEGATSKLSLVSLPLIGELAEVLVKEPGVQLEVVCHTAGTGDEKKDMTLSRRRADAVRNALVQREAPAGQVTATGRGSQEPLAPNVTRSGRKLNERTELRLSGPDSLSR